MKQLYIKTLCLISSLKYNILTILVMLIINSNLFAQEFRLSADHSKIERLNNQFKNGLKQSLKQNKQKNSFKNSNILALVTDTLQYGQAKETGLRALSVNNSTSARAVSQYFDAPGPVTISGVTFYAWASNNTQNYANVDVEIHYVTSDSLPNNNPLVSTTVTVNDYSGTGTVTLPAVKREAIFNTPVTVTQPYVIVLKNHSPFNIAVVSNDYVFGDGQEEGLTGVDLFGTWTHGYDVLVGGSVFDCDFYLEPHISYDIDTDFSMSPNTNTGNNTVTVTSNGTIDAFIENRMYNQAAFNNQSTTSYMFNFNDGSPIVNNTTATHTFASGGTQTIRLSNTIEGWTNTITDTEIKNWSESLSVDDVEVSGFSLYPNPIQDGFKIEQSNFQIEEVSITNINGKQLKIFKEQQALYDISELQSGLYVINIKTDLGHTISRKLVKE